MIVECGKISIDTELNHVEHKEVIQKVTTFFCDTTDPVYWFTQNVNDYKRFFLLHYNKKGDMLINITSWERIPDEEMPMKKVKVYENDDSCYFTKNDHQAKFHWGEKRDSNTIFRDQQTHWRRPRNLWGTYKK